MKKFTLIYLMIGLLLISGLVYFTSSDISEINKKLYKKAIELEDTIESQVWHGFKISKYPLAIRKGKDEYVFYNGDIKKREALLDVYAFTAFKVDGETNIFMLPYEDMDTIINPTGIPTGSSNENQYIATIFHEGFHAYQWDNFEEIIIGDFYDINEVNRLLDKIDNDESIKSMYVKEMEMLYNGLKETDKFKKEVFAKAYISEREKRNKVLKEKLAPQEFETLNSVEKHYELVEGTAHYIEIKTVEILDDMDSYEALIDSINNYHRNNTKYYKSGMGISLLLDELDYNWKDDLFRDNRSLYEILNSVVGGI